MTLDPAIFRSALGSFCSGVTVISASAGEEVAAITVSAFTSVSLEPPLILVCVGNRSRMNRLITESGRFAVSILRDEQEEVSNRFGRPTAAKDDFTFESWNDIPVIDGALVNIVCDLNQAVSGGDHQIYLGEVVEARVSDGEPLIYYRGAYHARTDRPVPENVSVGL